jgi:hypothetical protein
MLNERIPLKGRLSISLNGKVIREIENLVVTTGTDWVADRISNATVTNIEKMIIGTDATAASAGDMWAGATAPATSMTASMSQSAALATLGGTVTGSDIQFSTTFLGAGGSSNAAINEAGLLTSDDILIARTTFNTVNKDYNDEMTITWTISISSS